MRSPPGHGSRHVCHAESCQPAGGLLQSETRFHSQAPLERLYAALAAATSDSELSTQLANSMREAAGAQQATLRGLRERDAEATRRREGRSHEGADMMASLHALLEAKLEFMQVRRARVLVQYTVWVRARLEWQRWRAARGPAMSMTAPADWNGETKLCVDGMCMYGREARVRLKAAHVWGPSATAPLSECHRDGGSYAF